ncbi:hypothetical protein BH23ACT9_BH23ACT9_24160 [soil metagenome]
MSTDTTAPSAPTKTFADFGVDAAICESLAEVGITSPFPIQEMTLPLALAGADIIGQARTGTGKTLGFGLPLLQRLDLAGGLQALIIVPTRELCLQVSEDLAQAGRGRGVKVVALYGGKAMQPQIDSLADGVHVVVGTPGRLLDLARRGFLHLGSVNGLVLDEADEMLDLGFLPDVEQLVEQCAEQRQTLLFSATMPAQIVSLARRYMTKPTFMRADVEEIRIAPETQQYFFSCHRMDKPAILARILQSPNRGLCVVFCRTKRMADILAEELRERDVPALAIHSDLRQEARERALQKFREGKVTVLCATEVAARGLDIDDVSHVVNYDCPEDEKMYLHRIGRTGRAGASGVAITFAVWNELPRLDMIRRELDIDDEIHEVFSTSPLLEQLFDLPVREERAKVPSPPQARSGKASKSRRRAEQAEDAGKAEDEAGSERGSRRRGGSRRKAEDATGERDKAAARTATPAAAPPRAAAARDDDDAEQPRKRTRRRSRTVEATDPVDDRTADDRTADDDRERTRPPSAGRSRATTRPTSDDREQADTTGTADTADVSDGAATSDADQTEQGGTRRRRRTTTGGQTDRDDKVGNRKATTGERARQESGGRQDRERAGTSSRKGSDGEDDRRGQPGRGQGKSRSGGGRGRQAERSGGGRGRNNRDEGDRNGRSDRPRKVTIDSGEARGDGQPRLSRKLEVQHLP